MVDVPMKKGTILIVDDEPNVQWFISKTVQPMGYETLTAGSGMEALKMIQECGDKIDLVLLDLHMPGMGGIEVLKSIRKHQPEMSVIVLTALHDKRDECEKIGVDAFMKKPYSLEDLYRHIERVIEKKSFDREGVQIEQGVIPSAKILIVDDEAEVCELLRLSLSEDIQDCQFEVKTAKSGDEALRLSLEFEPDIGIIDIKMPFMWGDELVQRFKNGEGKSPKDFVIYTSITEPKEVERARRLGHKILSKPTNLESLVEVLKKICVRHNLLKRS